MNQQIKILEQKINRCRIKIKKWQNIEDKVIKWSRRCNEFIREYRWYTGCLDFTCRMDLDYLKPKELDWISQVSGLYKINEPFRRDGDAFIESITILDLHFMFHYKDRKTRFFIINGFDVTSFKVTDGRPEKSVVLAYLHSSDVFEKAFCIFGEEKVWKLIPLTWRDGFKL